MTDDELNEWLDAYLTRNPERRAGVVDALAETTSLEARREVIERLQEDGRRDTRMAGGRKTPSARAHDACGRVW